MRVHSGKHSIRIHAQMHQSDSCAGPAHVTEQAQPLNLPPWPQHPNVDLHVADVRLRAARGDHDEIPARGRAD